MQELPQTQLEAPPGMIKCKSDPGFVPEGQLIDIGPPAATAESVRNLASVQVVDEVNGIVFKTCDSLTCLKLL